MALPNSGAITHQMIQEEFGGSNPIGLNEYYGVAAGIPSSGAISNSDFYGASAAVAPTISYLVSGASYSDPHYVDRKGWGAGGKTEFFHPEAGQTSDGFGTVTGYVGVVGGYDLVGIQGTDYSAWTDSTEDRHITFTVNNPYGTNPNWTKFKCQIGSSTTWYTLYRSHALGWRDNAFGYGVITFELRTIPDSERSNFMTMWNGIRGATSSSPLKFYFE